MPLAWPCSVTVFEGWDLSAGVAEPVKSEATRKHDEGTASSACCGHLASEQSPEFLVWVA